MPDSALTKSTTTKQQNRGMLKGRKGKNIHIDVNK